jgi:hypothetical protein
MSQLDKATQVLVSLRKKKKQGVFTAWTTQCLGKIHNAKVHEMRKSWMIYDIIRSQFGELIAEQVA